MSGIRARLLLSVIVMAMVMLLPAACYAAGNDWPQFHNTVDSAGYSDSSAPDTNAILWASDNIGANMSSSPVIAGGRVYAYCCPSSDGFSADSSTIVCLDEATGAKLWQTTVDTAQNGSWSSPAYDSGKVFIGSGSKAFCLDAASGAILWSYALHYPVTNGSPRVAGGKAFFTDWGGSTSYIYCLDESTGNKLWTHLLTGYSQSTPAYYNGKVYVNSWKYTEGAGTGANNTYCLDAGDGHQIWLYQGLTEETCGSPCVADGKVFINSYGFYSMGELAALDAGDGHVIWGPMPVQRTDNTPAYHDGRVYLSGGCTGYSDQDTYCFNANSGQQIWMQTDVGNWTCSVAVADNKVFVGKSGDFFDYSGLYCLDAGDGHVVWSSDQGGSTPAVADGKVFSFKGGKVYAFGAANVAVTGVTLDKTNDTITVGGSATLTATVAPANATNKNVTWTSDNETVATVDQAGKVTAAAAGTATITATTADGSFTVTCLVTVTGGFSNYQLSAGVDPADGGSVNLDPAGGSYAAGTVVTITASPASGYSFDHWSGDLGGGANPATITMNADKSVTACFRAQTSWSLVTEGIPGVSFSSIWGSSARNVWVVGQQGTILHYDGNAWSQVTSGTGIDLWGVWGSAAGDVWAVGGTQYDQDEVILHYDGSAWTPVSCPSSGALYCIWGDAANDIWAGGNRVILHYDGSAWQDVSPKNADLLDKDGFNDAVTGIWSSSANDAWAAGEKVTNSYGPFNLLLHYDGSAWTKVSCPDNIYNIESVWGSSASDVWVVGANTDFGGAILHYDGNTWTETTSPIPSSPWSSTRLTGVWGNGHDDVYAYGGGLIHYDGKEWIQLNTDFTDVFYNGWSCASDIWAVGNGEILHGVTGVPRESVFALSASVDPAGGGSVSLDPAGGSYTAGTVVTITASPASGYSFDHWSGDLSGGANPATITIDADKSVTACFKTSSSVSVTGVTLDKASDTITVGNTDTLTATVTPADATNQTVTWSSDNQSVATVNANGAVTAMAPGSATVTVTTADGSFTATCLVTVAGTPVITPSGGSYSAPQSITVSISANLAVDQSVYYTTDGTDPTVAGSVYYSAPFQLYLPQGATTVRAAVYNSATGAWSGVTSTVFTVTPPVQNSYDLNGDGRVNVQDLVLIGQHFGETGAPGWIPEDINKDGLINVQDLVLVGQHLSS